MYTKCVFPFDPHTKISLKVETMEREIIHKRFYVLNFSNYSRFWEYWVLTPNHHPSLTTLGPVDMPDAQFSSQTCCHGHSLSQFITVWTLLTV